MSSNRFARPKITWGTSFANTLNVGYPLDNVSCGSDQREGSEVKQGASGIEDSWVIGIDYVLVGDIRWIPQVDTTTPLATGWDGTAKVREFLEWARQKNQFRFFPDATSGTYILSYLVEPMKGQPTPEVDGTRRLTITIRNTSTPYDGY